MIRRSTLFVAALVVLAGCAGGAGDSPSATAATSETTAATAPTTTGTTTAAPTNGTTATPPRLAPGVTPSGITNVSALFAAHERALLRTGFVANQTSESLVGGDATQRTRWATAAEPGGSRALTRATEVGVFAAPVVSETWLNETTTVSRRVVEGETEYAVRPRLDLPGTVVWSGGLLWQLQFYAEEFEVATVERRNGTRFVTLNATVDRVGHDGEVDTVSTLVVDETGRVRHYEATVSYGGDDTWHYAYDLERVGGVSLEPPSWLDGVPESARLALTLDASVTPEGVVVLEHLGGDEVPAGTIVTVLSNGTLHRAALNESLAEGESRYLSLADGRLRVSADRPPADAVEPVAREFTIRVVTADGVELLEVDVGW